MSAFYGPTPVQSLFHKQHFWRKLENYNYDPELAEAERITYFNNRKEHPAANMYDALFNQPPGWDQHRPRCDRTRMAGTVRHGVYREDEHKVIPLLWSFRYGRPCLPQYDFPDKAHLRRPQISAFYRRFGLNLNMELEQKAM